MSLFGGDSAELPSSPGFPDEDSGSDFSIQEFNPTPQHVRQSSSNYPLSDAEQDLSGIPEPDILEAAEGSDEYQDTDADTDAQGLAKPSIADRKWARAWRHYTKQEMAIAASLDQLRSQDLGAHLYNAHALKARLRNPATATDPSTRKSKWVPRDATTGEKQWYPDSEWTAWPDESHVSDAPASSFQSHVASDGFAINPAAPKRIKLSHDLEQEMYATFLRRAKDMWHETCEGTVENVLEMNTDIAGAKTKADVVRGERSESRDGTRSRSASVSRPLSSRSASVSAPTNASQIPDSSVMEVSNPSSGPPVASSSQALPSSPASPQTSVKDEDYKDEEDMDVLSAGPVFSADDERSHQLLAPTVRHVMSKLDHLLLALHHQREGQYFRDRDAGDTSDNSASAASPHAPSTYMMGLRDWSELLGVAAMSGWDSSIIRRAAKRCEGLFGETMIMRTLPEHGPIEEGIRGEALASSSEDESEGYVEAGGYLCPVPMCKRHNIPFERAWRFRDHLKRSHKKSTVQIAAIEKEAQDRMSRSQPITVGRVKRQSALDFNPRGWVPPDPLRCPHCGNSPLYPKLKRLLDHLKRTHRYDPRIQAEPTAAPASEKKMGKRPVRHTSELLSSSSGEEEGGDDEEDDDSDSDDETGDPGSGEEMLGGVHLDGFLQPVFRQSGRGKDKEARLNREKGKRSKRERKAAKRKRAIVEEEEER